MPVEVRNGLCLLGRQRRLSNLVWWQDFKDWWAVEAEFEIGGDQSLRLCHREGGTVHQLQ